MRRMMLLASALVVAVVLVSVASGSAGSGPARWVMNDLGTLGGPGSSASAINGRGQVVGEADTKAKDPFGDPLSHAFLWQNGKMRDLGTLGGEESSAGGINGRGQIVGWANTEIEDSLFDAFLWQNGKMRDLGTLGGPASWEHGPGGEASEINERGQIVGSAATRVKDPNGSVTSHAFLWEDGKMRGLGTFGGPHSYAVAINGRGQVVGWADTKAEVADVHGIYVCHAFLWQNGKMRDLGTLGGPASSAGGINERGQIVGSAYTKARSKSGSATGMPIRHAFLWENGRMRDLGTLGGPESYAAGINDSGQIVGSAATKAKDTDGEPVSHAFLWQNGKMTDLGTLPGGRDSYASAINDKGQIVGWATTKSGQTHAVLWTLRSG